MLTYCVFNNDGMITSVGQQNSPADANTVMIAHLTNVHGANNIIFDIPLTVQHDTHYVEDGELVTFPTKPGPNYIWSWEDKEWKEDFTILKAAKFVQIEHERDQSISSPISYDDAMFDADARAQSNIMAKLAELSARVQSNQELPVELLVWRDADNLLHSFSTQAEYQTWLNGLAIAVSTRATQAYATSWARKAALEAATSLADINQV